MLSIFGDQTLVLISWPCKKQTAVSRSCTEAEVISLGTSLRVEGLLALTLWDLVIDVLEPLASRARSDPSRYQKSQTSQTAQESIDHVPPNAEESSNRAQLFVVEDNEAVAKMIIKVRSPQIRHVSRTHRVNFDWLFGRDNLDSNISENVFTLTHRVKFFLYERFFQR